MMLQMALFYSFIIAKEYSYMYISLYIIFLYIKYFSIYMVYIWYIYMVYLLYPFIC